MCGRYVVKNPVTKTGKLVKSAIQVEDTENYNAHPYQKLPVIKKYKNGNTLEALKWGLIPGWAKDKDFKALINARLETIDEKVSFKKLIKNYRCVAVADGFYEWKRGGASPVPYYISLLDRTPFTFAAIWEGWAGPAGEDWIETVSLVTKPANGIVKKIHHRSPVIIAPEDYGLWLRPSDPPDRGIFSKLSVDLDHKLCVHEVSPYVNHTGHDGEQCIKPVKTDQFKLF